AEGFSCYGSYRPPAEQDLIALGNIKRDKEKQTAAQSQSPYEALSEETKKRLAASTKNYYADQYKRMQRSAQIYVDNAVEFTKPLMDAMKVNLSEREIKEIVRSATNQEIDCAAEEMRRRLDR
ncbi:MAG TPA: hypothetical protein VGB68_15175, partial [Pyrinomonadaceae bacterium]